MAAPRAPHNQYSAMEFPDYEFREFPKMIYAPTGETTVVHSAEEQAKFDSTWRETPHPDVLILNPEEQAAKKALEEAADRALEVSIRAKIANELAQEAQAKKAAEIEARLRAEMTAKAAPPSSEPPASDSPSPPSPPAAPAKTK